MQKLSEFSIFFGNESHVEKHDAGRECLMWTKTFR